MCALYTRRNCLDWKSRMQGKPMMEDRLDGYLKQDRTGFINKTKSTMGQIRCGPSDVDP